jgi:hypothetical protein
MELFLNALWICLALAAPIAWLVRSRPDRSARRLLAGLFAFACIAILLFPVISATDDLHAMQVANEDSSTAKKLIVQAGERLAVIGAAATSLLERPVLWSRVTDAERVLLPLLTGRVNISNRPPPIPNPIA